MRETVADRWMSGCVWGSPEPTADQRPGNEARVVCSRADARERGTFVSRALSDGADFEMPGLRAETDDRRKQISTSATTSCFLCRRFLSVAV
jgi:hypothetical protein